MGSLSFNNYNNNVSRITENVLRRFRRGRAAPGAGGSGKNGVAASKHREDQEERKNAGAQRRKAGSFLAGSRQRPFNAPPRPGWAARLSGLPQEVPNRSGGTAMNASDRDDGHRT